MQNPVRELLKMGSLPLEEEADPDVIGKYEELVLKIKAPLTKGEATALVALLGDDSCYGLAWTLIHAIETAPTYVIDDHLKNRDFVRMLEDRSKNASKAEGAA